MPAPDTTAIDTQITAALGELAKFTPDPPTVTVDGLLQLIDVEAAAKNILQNPRAIGDEVKKMLAAIAKAPLSIDVQLTADVVTSLDDVAALLHQLRDTFTNGSLAAVDVPPIVRTLAGKIVDAAPPGLIDLAKTLRARAPMDAFAHLFTGSNSGALSAPRIAMLKKVREIADAVSELLPITVRLDALSVAVDDVVVLFNVQPPAKPDFQVIAPKLVKIDADIDVLIGDLTPLLRKVAAKLDAIETTAFTARLIATFDAIAEALPDAPVRLGPLFDPLREAREELHDLAEGDLSAMINDIVADVRASLESTGLQNAGTTIQSIVNQAIAAVDLQGLKTRIQQALEDAKKSVGDAAVKLPAELKSKIDTLGAAIEAIDVDGITDPFLEGLDEIKIAYDAAIHEVAENARQLLEDNIGQYIDDLTKSLGDLDAELQDLAKELDAIDFEAAAAESRRLMEEIRTNVEEALQSADLPPAARTAISLGAKALQEIKFDESIAQPIHAELDKADPTPILARIEEEVAKLRALIATVIPSELAAQLDPPFDRAMAALKPFSSDALKERVVEEMAKLKELLDRCDPGPLLAKLEAEHAKLVAAAKANAMLDPFFAPIEKAYADAIAAIGALHLHEFLDAVTAEILAIPPRIETAMHEAMIEAAALTAQIPNDFHLGDILRPLAEVVADLRDQLDATSDAQLEAIATAVVAPVVFFQNLGDLHAVFGSNPVVAIDAAFDELTGNCESLQAELQAQTTAGNTTIELNLHAKFEAVTPDVTALVAAAQRLAGRIATPELIASANRLAAAIEQAMPPELLAIDETTSPRAALDRILDTVDPAPLVTELDQIGTDVDVDVRKCAQAIAGGIIQLVHEMFGVLNAADLNTKLQETLTAIEGQLALLDAAPVKQNLQALADSIVKLLEAFAPMKFKASIDAAIANVHALVDAMGAKLNKAIDKLPDLPADLETLRPSTVLEPLVEQTKELQAAVDKILGFEFGEPLLRTIERLRPAVDEVLDDLFVELDRLLEFMERQKAA
jgi:uncharacterized protein YqgV (UPF0045/DUF77 family)